MMSKHTVAVLLILALVFAGIGVGIAINNYQATVRGQFTEVPSILPTKTETSGEVIIEIEAPGGEEGG